MRRIADQYGVTAAAPGKWNRFRIQTKGGEAIVLLGEKEVQRVPLTPGQGALGFVLTFLAAALQQRRIGLHPVYFDHNALYHTVQGIGLLGVFLGARAAIGGKTAC